MNGVPRCEHPRPDRKREAWLSLNGTWDFEIDNDLIGKEMEYFKRDSLNGKITVPFCPESRLSGIGHTDFMNSVWYRRNISIPTEWAGKRIVLHIDACDYETTVYVNGGEVGTHKGGYTSFSFDITDYLLLSDNYLTVCAIDDTRSPWQQTGKQSTKPESYSCFYTRTTGIWQSVWLEAVAPAHVISYKAYPNIADSSVSLGVKLSEAAMGKTLRVTALYDGNPVGSNTVKINSLQTNVYIKLSEKHLWELGNGCLYDLVFEVIDTGACDVLHGYFGLREVYLTLDGGLRINGKTVFGRFVLDQGFYPDGIYTAPSDDALIFDIEASMKCGFNGARLHQKVFEPRFLYHADRLGYMVFGETPCWGLDYTSPNAIYHFLPEWLEEIDRDFSHPSIIGWCPFNETWDIEGRHQCNEFIDTIYDITHAIDPTRPVVTNSGSLQTRHTDSNDYHDYEQDPVKFAHIFDETEKGIVKDQFYRMNNGLQTYFTDLPIFVSEYGGIAWVVKKDDTAWGYGASVKSEDEFFARLEGLTDVLLSHPRIFGFCYTQLTDVEQEQNGLLTYDRQFKFNPEKYHRILTKPAVIEKNN